MEARSIVGRFDKSVILKAQVDNLTGRNDELRREMKETRYELLKMQDNYSRTNRKVLYCIVGTWHGNLKSLPP